MITNHNSEVSSLIDIFTTINILRDFDRPFSLTHFLTLKYLRTLCQEQLKSLAFMMKKSCIERESGRMRERERERQREYKKRDRHRERVKARKRRESVCVRDSI
jgi:hypothetical protein